MPAVRPTCLRSSSAIPSVRLTKMGITPNGFTIARRVVNIFIYPVHSSIDTLYPYFPYFDDSIARFTQAKPHAAVLDFISVCDRLSLKGLKETCITEDIMKDNTRIVGAAFLVGGIVGTAIALLYAPQSGRDTRKDISKTVRRVKNKTVDVLEETIDGVADFADELREMAADIADQGMDLSVRAKKEVLAILEHGQQAIEKQSKKVADALNL
jgi:gas vesicle protein